MNASSACRAHRFRSVTSTAFVLSMFMLAACGGTGTPAVGVGPFCTKVEAGANALLKVLEKCPDPGDASAYGYNGTACNAHAEAACTASERTALESILACEGKIAPCLVPGDRSRAMTDMIGCAASAKLPSNGCLTGISK